MPNAETLNQLFPLALEGALAADHAVAGTALDAAEVEIGAVRDDIFPFLSFQLLSRWEELLAIVPDPADLLQTRRDRVVAKLRSRGSLTLAYFQGLAAAFGVTVTIVENLDHDPFKWGVLFASEMIYYFRAGESVCGDYLADTVDLLIQLNALFQDLKPAHTQCVML